MAILLAAGINATQNRVTLTEPLTAAPGDLFRIDNEVVEFGGYGRMAGGRLVDHSRKIVSFGRGVNGTTAATHTATTAVLRVVDGLVSAVGAPDPFVTAGGGGSVTVADADPGAVGAGGLWLQTNAGEGGAEYVRLWVRNATDDGWLATGPISVLNGNVQSLVGPTATIEIGLDEDAGAFSVSGATQVQLNAASIRLGTSVRVELRQGTADPSAAAGIAAPVGSLYMRQTAVDGVGSLWQKVGDADTEWSLVGFTDTSLAAYVAAGNIDLTSAGPITLTADAGENIELEAEAVRLNGVALTTTGDVAVAIDAAIDALDITNPLTADLETAGFSLRTPGGAVAGQVKFLTPVGDFGGEIDIEGGPSTLDGGGNVGVFGGQGEFGGGNVEILGGIGVDGDGGAVELFGGETQSTNGVGGDVLLQGGEATAAGGVGGGFSMRGGTATDGGTPAQIILPGASVDAPGSHGVVEIASDGVTFNLKQAAFVANGSTVDQLRDSLIAAGLMAAS